MKRHIQVAAVLVLALSLGPASGAAAQAPSLPRRTAAIVKAMEAAMNPGEGQKRLNFMVGEFDVKIRTWIDPSKAPFESRAVAVCKWVLGDRYIQQMLSGFVMGEPWSGIGYAGYDNVAKKYMATYMDSACTGMEWFTGAMAADGKSAKLTATISRRDHEPAEQGRDEAPHRGQRRSHHGTLAGGQDRKDGDGDGAEVHEEVVMSRGTRRNVIMRNPIWKTVPARVVLGVLVLLAWAPPGSAVFGVRRRTAIVAASAGEAAGASAQASKDAAASQQQAAAQQSAAAQQQAAAQSAAAAQQAAAAAQQAAAAASKASAQPAAATKTPQQDFQDLEKDFSTSRGSSPRPTTTRRSRRSSTR